MDVPNHKIGRPPNIIKDINKYNNDFENSIRVGVENTTKLMYSDIIKYVNYEIYVKNVLRQQNSDNERNKYERTYTFLNSISYKIIKTNINNRIGYKGFVYIDYDKMTQGISFNGLGQHMGVKYTQGEEDGERNYITDWYGKDIRAWLVNWIENGNKNRFRNNLSSRFAGLAYDGIHMFGKAQDRMSNEYVPDIVRYVSKQSKVGIVSVLEKSGGAMTKNITKVKPKITK